MSLPRIVITAGEPAGIGPDVILKALQSDITARIAVVADADLLQRRANMLGIACEIQKLDRPNEVSAHSPHRIQVLHTPCLGDVVPGTLNVANARYVVTTLEKAASLTQDGVFDAIVTAPVQKSIINDSGIPFSGHTEFFADFFRCEDVVMLLTNQKFKVALATTHLPLRDVPNAISKDGLCKQFRIIHHSFRELYGVEKPRIAMLGLNPHAGEGGHLGKEELDTLIPARDVALSEDIDISLPIPADTAFVSEAGKRADVFLAMYHDQGLPVLKTAGFGHSVNVTLGLPIIRTSVDHGTALELAASGKASEGSLIAAINEAIVCAHHQA